MNKQAYLKSLVARLNELKASADEEVEDALLKREEIMTLMKPAYYNLINPPINAEGIKDYATLVRTLRDKIIELEDEKPD